MSRSLALSLLLLAACSSNSSLDCPTGTRAHTGSCRVICGGQRDCLSSEQCDPTDHVCVQGTAQDAEPKDLGFAEDVDAGEPDLGRRDADEPDVEMPDDGFKDADPPEVVVTDASDARFPDADPPDVFNPDADEPDLGPPDTGTTDAEPVDGGVFTNLYGVAIMRNAGIDLIEIRPGRMNTFLRSIPTTASTGKPTWSTTAGRIAFETSRTLQGGQIVPQVEIYSQNGVFIDAFDAHGPDWWRDPMETMIAAASNDGTMIVLHPTAGPITPTPLVEAEPAEIRWDPSGNIVRLAFTAAVTTRRDLFVRYTNLATRFTITQSPETYVWSPNGSRMAVVDSRFGCRLADARIGATSLTSISTWVTGLICEQTLLAWSPDGAEVALVQQAPGSPASVYIIPATLPLNTPLSQLAPLLTNQGQIVDLEWTPDSQFIGFSRRTGNGFDLHLEPVHDPNFPDGDLQAQPGPGQFSFRPVN